MSAFLITIAVLVAFFCLLVIAGEWVLMRTPLLVRGLPAAYVTLVIPWICLLIALTVILQFPMVGYLMGIVLVHLAFLLTWWFGRKRVASSAFLASMNKRVVPMLPLFYGGIFWGWFYQRYQPRYGSGWIAALTVMVAVFTIYAQSERLQNVRLRLRAHWWIYLLLGLLLVGLVFQPELPFLRSHFNPVLATMQDVSSGKAIFVNSLSQYGVGVIYFLLAVFEFFRLPISYAGLSAVLNVLYILHFALLFLILYKATKNIFLSLAGLGAILYFAFFALAWPSMLRLPGQSPLRYGLTYLVLGVGWIGINRAGRFWRIVELALLGAASVWSLEVFLYSILSLDALLFIGEVLFSRQRKTSLHDFIKRVLLQIAVVFFCWSAWWAATWIFSGQPPNLSYYFDVFKRFSTADGGHHINFHAFWTGVAAAVYVGTIVTVLYAGWKRRDWLSGETASIMAGLSITGLFQHLYFFVYDLDFHISLVCTPLVMLAILWIFISQNVKSAERFPRLTRWIFGLTVIASMWVCMVQTSPWFGYGIGNSLLKKSILNFSSGEALTFTDPYRFLPSNDKVSIFVAFTEKYAAGERSIAIFAQPDDQVEVLFLTHKTHILDFTDPVMCTLSRSFGSHILKMAESLAGVPEYIFYDSSKGVLMEIQIKAFQLLTAGASYSVVDREGAILVYRRG